MNYPTLGAADISKRDWAITRERVAEFISSTQGVNYSRENAVRYLLWKGFAVGKNSTNISVGGFDPKGTLTRAEAVTFIRSVKEKGISKLLPRPEQPSDTSLLPLFNDGGYDTVYNPTSNPDNLIQNPDGTFSLGNIKMVDTMANQTPEEYQTNMLLFSNIQLTTSGHYITSIQFPATGRDNYEWWVSAYPAITWKSAGASTFSVSIGRHLAIHLMDVSTGKGVASCSLSNYRPDLMDGKWRASY